MREILFRGKRTDTGEWAKGYYVRVNHHWHKYGIHKDWIVAGACANGGWFVVHCKYPVKKETVGQYAGEDKYGNEVFEGDVVRSVFNKALFIVCFGEYTDMDYCEDDQCACGWYVKDKYGYESALGSPSAWVEVIGNIHDNPELMKGE